MLDRIDRLRLLALLLWLLPAVALVPLGAWWLWQNGAALYWLAAMVGFSLAGYGLQVWLRRRDRKLLAGSQTAPDPHWPPRSQAAWEAIESMAARLEPKDWPLTEGPRLATLGRDALAQVARVYHPDRDAPLLELTLPHGLLIAERACRDLRTEIATQIPLSHRLTLGDLVRAYRWKATAERLLDLYRAGRLVVNPVNALLGELWERLRRQSFGAAWDDLHRWLLQEYVRKIGYYAIALYSGQLVLDGEASADALTASSRQALDRARAHSEESAAEPLRILILGRTGAGKSSLVNALFGYFEAPTHPVPDRDNEVLPYRLERDGLPTALVFDTPGIDSDRLSIKALERLASETDLTLWVSAAHRPDRESERRALDRLRAFWAARQDRHAPPLLVALSHIDLLKPPRDWQPPYDLANPHGAKAINIRDALEGAARDLGFAPADTIPVCLAAGRVYNVDDSLLTAILERLDEAHRTRLLRCLDVGKRSENWRLLRRQMESAGRFLASIPERLSR